MSQTETTSAEKLLQDFAGPFHSEIGRQAKLYGQAERAIGLRESNNHVTHRQPSVDVYTVKDVAWFIGDGLDMAYSVSVDDLGRAVVELVRGTDYQITFYDIDRLTEETIRYLGGPIAKEAFAETNEQ